MRHEKRFDVDGVLYQHCVKKLLVGYLVEVTLPTLCLLCHHEDDVAQAICCIVNRLAPALRVRPPGTVTRFKRNVRDCPIPASTHAGLETWIRKEAR
jgi:hypothetical protein